MEPPQFGLSWALGPFLEMSPLTSAKVEWKVRLKFFLNLGSSEMEQGSFMALFQNMVRELCDLLFSFIRGLEASRKKM